MWELDCEESWVPKNWCFWSVVLEKTLESPLDCKEIQLVHPEGDQSWVFIRRTDAETETPILWPPHAELTHWKRLWCWEGLRAGGERDDWGWDGWMASLAWWTWVWVNSRSWWWTGRPGLLWFMGSQRVEHDCVTELNWLKTTMVQIISVHSTSELQNWNLFCYLHVDMSTISNYSKWSTCSFIHESVSLQVLPSQCLCASLLKSENWIISKSLHPSVLNPVYLQVLFKTLSNESSICVLIPLSTAITLNQTSF